MRYCRPHCLCLGILVCLLVPSWASAQRLVMGTGPATEGVVRVLDPVLGDRSFTPYPGFVGGIRVAQGDVNGDGVLDIITAPGPGGGPHVYVFDGATLGVLASFMAYDPSFTGGVFVAAGDVNGDGKADIVTGAGAGGGPHVRVFSGADLSELRGFFAYSPFFAGGVSVAAGDVNGDGFADIVTGAGPSGGPHVVVYSGVDLSGLASFYAYDPFFPGGVNVAAGDMNGDGRADIITGAGPGGGPHVQVFDGATLGVLASYFAYDPAFVGGVTVTAGDYNGDGVVDVITGPGWGGGPHVQVFSGDDYRVLASFMAFGSGGGVFVGAQAESGLRVTSAAATSFTVGTPGTFTITTAGQPTPTLTVSGTLPAGVTFVDNGDGTGTLSGTPAPGTGGTHPLTITATNGVKTVTQSFTLTVNQVPAFTSAAAATFTTGAAGSFTVTTTGFPLPTLTQGGAALPAGVTFVDNGNGTGTLSGTPPVGSGGTFALTFTADNGVGVPVVQAFTLTVSGAPTFTSAATATFTAGSAGTFTVTTIATPTAALSVSGTLPAGVTFVDGGAGSGTLSGTPAAGTGGTYPLTFTATNSVGSATQSFTLTVLQAPAITSAAATTFTVGLPGTFAVTTTGLPVPSLAIGGATLPAGVVFVDNGNGTGTLSGTPAAGTGGSYALTFTATNSVGASAPQAFTLTVNAAPAFTSAAAATFAVGVAGSFTVTTVGTPQATLSVGALPGGVTFVDNLNGTGTLSGTPAAGTAGLHTLTFTATNGVVGPVTQTFTLTIIEGPVITSASSTTFALGAVNTFTVTASGFPAPSLVQDGALPSGVTWVDNGDGTGTLSGTADAGTGGTYALTFMAVNGSGSAVQNFTLTVSGSPGFTSANTTTLTVGAAGTFTVTTIGAPPPAITLSGALPSGVTFVDNGDGTGTLSGTPAAGTGGVYALTFTAANGVLPDGTQSFTLNVNEAPVITSAASATFTIGVAGSFTVTTSGLPLPAIAIGGVALPAGVTFTDNGNGTGTLSGTPAAGTGGTYALTFTATNTIGSSAPQAFTLTVSAPPAITSANTTTFSVGSAGSFIVTATGAPAPALSISGTLPAGVTFVDNGGGSGTLSGTPAAGTAGTYVLTITASNGVLPNATQAFTLTVQQAPAFTSANNTTFTLNTAGTFTVTTVGFPTPTVTLTTGTLPAGVTFTDNGNGTATLAGTPTATGVFALQFTAANGVGTPAVQSFTLTVSQPPAITSAASTTFTEDVAGSFTVTTQGFPTPALSVTGTLPAGVTFLDNGNGTGTLAGTAAAGGSFPLVITANNGVGSPVTQAFTLTVVEVNDAPSFAIPGDPAAVNEDAGPQTVASFATAISAGPANEAGQVLTFIVQTNTNPGLFSIAPAVSAATGALTYTSAPNAFGQATITLVLQDNGGTANGGVNTSAPQVFTITVLPVNDAPLVVNETFQLLGNTELRVDMTAGTTPHTSETTTGVSAVEGVLDNDGDPEGDPFAVTGILNCTVPDTTAPFDCTLTGGAVVHVDANGEFSYTPAPGATTGSFTYTVTDTPAQGTAASVNGTVTFTIVEMVWYVKNDAAAGNGTSRSPLNATTTLNGAGGAGDVDDGNDYIFVDFGDGTSTGHVGGLELEAGQQLIGEFVGLSIPVNLNGNGSPTVVVPPPAGDACSGGPCQPLLSHTTGNALSVTEAMPATIRGFRLAGGSAGNAIDVTTDGALTGSGTLTIADNIFQGAGLEGIDVNLIAGTTGMLALTVLGNVWDNAAAHAGNAIDIIRLAGTLNLTVSSNLNIESAANAVVIDGGNAANTAIVGFANNNVHTDTLGAGMLISNVTFNAVAGGVTTIGVDGNGVGAAGMTLTNVRGSLAFTDLDVYGASGLTVTGDAALGVALAVVAPGSGGTSEAKGSSGAAVNITNAAINLQFAELASTFVTGSGVSLTTVSGTFSAPGGSTIVKNGGGGAAFTVNNSAVGTTVLAATYGGTITNTSGTGGSVSIATADAGSSVSFAGAITDNPGTGISLAGNTGATVSFSGGLTLNGANSRFAATGGGTVTVTGTNTIGAITAPSGPALNVANTTIGASGMTFRRISANGGANGIVLNTTGAAGSFTVTGDGALTRNASGGVIQNTTDDCVRLTGASTVTLRQMDFLTCGDTTASLAANAAGSAGEHAVEVVGGSNVVLSAITINNPASTGILILDVAGTNRVNNNSLITHIDGRNVGGLGHGLYVFNNNVNMTLFDFRNSQITNNVAPNATFFVANGGTANMQADVRDSVFDDLSNQALTMAAGGVVTTTGTLTSNIINNDFINAKGVNENNLGVLVNNGATHVSLVQDNLFDNIAKDGTIANTSIVRTQNSGGVLNATVTANTIQNIAYGVGAGGRHAIGHVFEPVAFNAADSSTLIFSNNTISNITFSATNREAIFVDYRPTASGGEVTVQGNNINMPTAGTQQAIELRFRQTNASSVPVLVRGNTVTHNTAVNFLDVDAEDGANVQLTIDGNNNFTNTNATPGSTVAVATEDPVAAGGPSSMCVNITGNTLQGGTGTITLDETAGTMTITQASAAALAGANGIPAGNVTVTGAPAFGVAACTIP